MIFQHSYKYRKASIQTSKSTLPCSLLLLANDEGVATQKVIGFARVLEVVGDSSGALVESGEGKFSFYKLCNNIYIALKL